MEPNQALNTAVETGGVFLEFTDAESATAFKRRCRALMAREARIARREMSPLDDAWGKHPWEGVVIVQDGACLRVFKPEPPRVVRSGAEESGAKPEPTGDG